MPSEYLNALDQGVNLGEYQIKRVLGTGGFGLTYLAFDQNLDKQVAIKEYLPNDLAVRHGKLEVKPKSSSSSDDFKWGLEQFLTEAKTLAKFNHPNIIRINRFFEANGTGYIVMDYAQGQTLSERIKQQGPIKEGELKSIILAVGDGLKQAHSFGILHRDIKPSNIMLLDDGTPILIDFGSARQSVGVKSQSVTSIVTPGYAPIEQYDTNGKQGPWSDIYALGAVAYVALVGERPPDATARIRVDNMQPLAQQLQGKVTNELLVAIDWALAPNEDARPQSITSWFEAIKTGKVSKPEMSASHTSFDDEKTILNKRSSKNEAPREQPLKKERVASNSKVATSEIESNSHTTKFWVAFIVLVAATTLSYPYWSQVLKDFNNQNQQVNVASQTPHETSADVTSSENVDDVVEEQELSEQQVWDRAVAQNTIESYLSYLALYEDGMYVAEANTRLSTLSRHDNASGQFYTASRVNLRQWPSTNAPTIGSINLGEQVEVDGRVVSRNWYSLGEGGFVFADLVSDTPPANQNAERDRIRAEIKQRWRDAIERHNN